MGFTWQIPDHKYMNPESSPQEITLHGNRFFRYFSSISERKRIRDEREASNRF